MTEELLVRWTVRLSMLCYLGFLWLSLGKTQRSAWERAWWTIGALMMVVHVIAAFHFNHQWSHSQAVAETARRTHELIGWRFGLGVYFNYVFVTIWLADTAWWWLKPRQYARRPWWLSSLLHVYLLFIVINACIVFESGITRWAALLATAMLLARKAKYRDERGELLDETA